MNRNFTINDDILVKYLLHETSREEDIQVETWIKEQEANKVYFENFKLIWEQSKKLAVTSTVDANAAWEKFKQRIETPKETRTLEFRPEKRFKITRVAAILLVIICGGWFVNHFVIQHNPQYISMQTTDNTMVHTLPDGSVVTLNKSSKITYASNFKGKTRDVKLEGEAFFNVIADKSKPFVIDVNDVRVQVVGTSFNVKSRDEKTEVIVETGIVEVAKNENEVTLNPNEKATVSKDDAKPLKEKNKDDLYNYYRTKEFICNATPLWRLVDVLNEAYNVNIIISNNRLNNLMLTATFRNEPIDNVLAVISETFNIKVEKQGGNILLK